MRIARIIAAAAVMLFPFGACRSWEGNETSVRLWKTEGVISEISFVHEYIVLTCEEGYIKFRVPEGTRIERLGKPISLEDIDTEDSVSLQYIRGDKGERTAYIIRDYTWKRDY